MMRASKRSSTLNINTTGREKKKGDLELSRAEFRPQLHGQWNRSSCFPSDRLALSSVFAVCARASSPRLRSRFSKTKAPLINLGNPHSLIIFTLILSIFNQAKGQENVRDKKCRNLIEITHFVGPALKG